MLDKVYKSVNYTTKKTV